MPSLRSDVGCENQVWYFKLTYQSIEQELKVVRDWKLGPPVCKSRLEVRTPVCASSRIAYQNNECHILELPGTCRIYNPDANGCSSPFNLDFPFKKEFTPSCNRHDMCYGCAVAYGLTKADCDAGLLLDTIKTCKEISIQDVQDTENRDQGVENEIDSTETSNTKLEKHRKACNRINAKIGEEHKLDCSRNNVKYLECAAMADSVYAAVTVFGASHFEKVPLSYCDRGFIYYCLPKRS
ncbi:hypothetical protein RRG08_048504 [Elysia crispata]|uniref:Uncharacterized protein n=1 Tax=Elysia crispata TaxID=231223 RepID=A0AAE1CXX9_9GAST|nr:hypothetical protein RRG08_048504 [Elysia crispata]